MQRRTSLVNGMGGVAGFLVDKDGPVDTILMQSLKSKLGSGVTLEDTPKHLPADEFQFRLSNIIAGPLEVIPKGSTNFDVPGYGELQDHFKTVTKMNRNNMYLKIYIMTIQRCIYFIFLYIYHLQKLTTLNHFSSSFQY